MQIQARPTFSHPSVCRHWERGKGCLFGDSCKFRHDPSLRTVNLCHRWMRGKCKNIDCLRLHERAPGVPPPACRTPRRSRSSSLSYSSLVSRSRSPSVTGFKPEAKKCQRRENHRQTQARARNCHRQTQARAMNRPAKRR